MSPKNTGRTRKGRRGDDKTKLPDSLLVRWSHFGDDKGLAMYQHDAGRVTFNEDVPMMAQLRGGKQKMLLASIAAGHIAKDIEGSDKQKRFGFSNGDFAWIYRQMMERICPAHSEIKT